MHIYNSGNFLYYRFRYSNYLLGMLGTMTYNRYILVIYASYMDRIIYQLKLMSYNKNAKSQAMFRNLIIICDTSPQTKVTNRRYNSDRILVPKNSAFKILNVHI